MNNIYPIFSYDIVGFEADLNCYKTKLVISAQYQSYWSVGPRRPSDQSDAFVAGFLYMFVSIYLYFYVSS